MSGFKDPAATWDRRFDRDDYLFGREPNVWLARHSDCWRSGQRVLCVADGEGRNSVWLARRGLMVDAFDISPRGVEKARRLALEQRCAVDFAVADVSHLAWPEAVYDGVAAIFVQFADPALRARMFEGMRRCLKPGGVLVLQGYALAQLAYDSGGPGIAGHLYTRDLLEAEFAGWSWLAFEEGEQELSEGQGHHGRSAVIGLVARKPVLAQKA